MTGQEPVVRVDGGWRVVALRGSGVGELVIRPDSLAVHLGSAGIELASRGELTTDRGSYWVAASPQTNLGVLAGLVRQVVVDAHVFDNGWLVIEFGGGWRLTVTRLDGSADWSLHVPGVGSYSVKGSAALTVPSPRT